MTPAAERVRQRLRDGGLRRLAGLVVDHLLDRPVAAVLDPDWLADQLITALDAAARAPQTRRMLLDQLDAARRSVPPGAPAHRAPDELVKPLMAVLGRPVSFDRALVGRLLDHDAARRLVTDLLQTALRRFSDPLRPMASQVASQVSGAAQRSGGLGRLKLLGQGVRELGEGVLGGVGREIEHIAEHKVRDFVDGALASAMAGVADHLCDPAHAAEWGAYRVHVADTLLHTSNRALMRELEKFDLDDIVDVGLGVARAIAAREGARGEIAGLIRAALDASGGRSLRAFLREAGLDGLVGDGAESAFRARLEAQLVSEAVVFIETPAFGALLDELLTDGDGPRPA
jgi:hypothetical protein